MKNFTILSALLFYSFGFSQSLYKSSIDSGGGVASNNNIKILFTIGEVNVQEFNTGNILVSEGFIGGEFVNIILGVDDLPELTGITVYPNPVVESIVIKGLTEESVIYIYDIKGSTVFKQNKYTSGEALPVNNLKSGIYLLKITNSNGVGIRKIIKR